MSHSPGPNNQIEKVLDWYPASEFPLNRPKNDKLKNASDSTAAVLISW